MKLLVYSITLLLVLNTVIWSGCIRTPDKEYGGRGEILAVGAHKPKLMDQVLYSVEGQNFSISSSEDNFQIAVVKLRVVNMKSTQVTLNVDRDAVTIVSKDGQTFSPFYPEDMASKTSDIHPEGNPYGLHVWGSFQLNKGYEIAGTVFFEVPKGLEFSDTIWDNVEYVRVPYPK